jgi:hypothetical protein
LIIGLDSFRFEIVQYNKVIPEQFTVKAQHWPAAFIRCKKEEEGGRRRRRRGRSKNVFVWKSYELSRTVFKSEIGQQFFWGQKV